MNHPNTESALSRTAALEQRSEHSRAVAVVVGAVVGFVYAMFCFALAYFGAPIVGLVVGLALGALISATLGYFAGSKWKSSALAQCAGTAPYTLIFLIGGGISLADRLASLILMIGPAVIGTFVGFRIRHRRAA